jgi:hypothetical protein
MPDALEYAVTAFKRELDSLSQTKGRDALQAQIEKQNIQSELERLANAVATSGHSATLLEAIDARESRIREIDGFLKASGRSYSEHSPDRIRGFVVQGLSSLRELIQSDVARALSCCATFLRFV